MNNIKNYKTLKVSDLITAEWNYKENDDFLDGKLAGGIKKFGMVQNILVRQLDNGKYEVINGNHRLKIAQSLNIDELMVYDFGNITLATAQLIAVQTNETNFETNNVKLSEVIGSIKLEYTDLEMLDILPYTPEKLTDLTNLKDFDWDSYENRENNEIGGEKKVPLIFKYERHEYTNVIDCLRNAMGKLGTDTHEETLIKLLSKFE